MTDHYRRVKLVEQRLDNPPGWSVIHRENDIVSTGANGVFSLLDLSSSIFFPLFFASYMYTNETENEIFVESIIRYIFLLFLFFFQQEKRSSILVRKLIIHRRKFLHCRDSSFCRHEFSIKVQFLFKISSIWTRFEAKNRLLFFFFVKFYYKISCKMSVSCMFNSRMYLFQYDFTI